MSSRQHSGKQLPRCIDLLIKENPIEFVKAK